MKTPGRLVVMVACLAIAFPLAACAQGETAQDSSREESPTPSETYLETEPPAGWIRAVGRDDGFVIVFETPERFDASGAWEYRLVLFNESGSDVTWDGLHLGVEGVAVGAAWEGFSMGLGGPRQMQPAQAVTLRSGESTTSEASQILENPPLTYEVVGVAQAYAADTWLRSQTETLTVISE